MLALKRSFNIDDTMPALHEALNGHCHEILKLLDEAIEQYDFEQAEIIIKQLQSCINKGK
ncbi:MAG: hypothetical protein KZQ74_10270 [gamma proteobacterium symbiont of Bathyaustriella thionipta]|nr:hypothetical protein [gamma proteobacterium symbiont of Bathyaustriella thionipta]